MLKKSELLYREYVAIFLLVRYREYLSSNVNWIDLVDPTCMRLVRDADTANLLRMPEGAVCFRLFMSPVDATRTQKEDTRSVVERVTTCRRVACN